MNCWNMFVVAFGFISCAAAFKVEKVEPKVFIFFFNCYHIDDADDVYHDDNDDCAM